MDAAGTIVGVSKTANRIKVFVRIIEMQRACVSAKIHGAWFECPVVHQARGVAGAPAEENLRGAGLFCRVPANVHRAIGEVFRLHPFRARDDQGA